MVYSQSVYTYSPPHLWLAMCTHFGIAIMVRAGLRLGLGLR